MNMYSISGAVRRFVPEKVKSNIRKRVLSLAGTYPSAMPKNLVRFARPALIDGKVVFEFSTSGMRDTIFFKVPDGFHFHNDLAATSLISIFGKKFPNVYFDFEVSEKCLADLQRIIPVKMEAKGHIDPRRVGSKAVLAFSGGFDSLAGYLLCPEIYDHLASIDFGPLWKRERSFYETFDTTIIETDFRAKRYDRYHWMMMAAPIILYADYLDLDGIGFGTIFEATPDHLISPHVRHRVPDDFRVAVGLRDYTLTRGLTEFTTAKIIDRLAPNRAEASLKSLANEGTEKLFRKNILLRMVRNGGILKTDDVSDLVIPKDRVTVGKSFVMDYLYLSFASLIPPGIVDRIVDNPEILSEFRNTGIDMSWAWKYNPIFIDDIPYSRVGEVISKMTSLGIDFFDSRDFQNFEAFTNFWLALSRRK
ncbi:hypothetical protein U2P60_14830 [Brucella sp. H1_1004]|uniref:hypothetical protein n=1 Tax=Brucella sp. H1_1004 TaxID=3110109 RepID=UPI0039B51EFD